MQVPDLCSDIDEIFDSLVHLYEILRSGQPAAACAYLVCSIFASMALPKSESIDDDPTDWLELLSSRLHGYTELQHMLETLGYDSITDVDGQQITKLTCNSIKTKDIIQMGTLYQSLLTHELRRKSGLHYTDLNIISKVTGPLVFDSFEQRLSLCVTVEALYQLHDDLCKVRILDPACGTGNFLVYCYFKLKSLERYIQDRLHELHLELTYQVHASQFFGIELDPVAAGLATMSLKVASSDGTNPTIIVGNALKIDWNQFRSITHIVGNPPFIGTTYQSEQQKLDMAHVFHNVGSYRVLDYAAAWFLLAARYMEKTSVKAAFVATDSITQGVQPAALWQPMLQLGMYIDFAYPKFKWQASDSDPAGTWVVIIGFSAVKTHDPILFVRSGQQYVNHINAYLLTAPNVLIRPRSRPITPAPIMTYGATPRDGGHLILDETQKDQLLQTSPELHSYIKPYWSGKELLNGTTRWCLWFDGLQLDDIQSIPGTKPFLDAVSTYRQSSKRPKTKSMANSPHLFDEIRYPADPVLALPRVSSSQRSYIPVYYGLTNAILSDKVNFISQASLVDFGIIQSRMHLVWVNAVAGRLGGGYSYGVTTVYNNFPWPTISQSMKQSITKIAMDVLDVRSTYTNRSLGQLYSVAQMPEELVLLHHDLDLVIDLCYSSHEYKSDNDRITTLFLKYAELNVN